MDAYVCEGVTGGRDNNGNGGGGPPLGDTEAQIRAVGLALLRLQARVDPLDELHAELEVRKQDDKGDSRFSICQKDNLSHS